ncbi:hypothetical protein Br6_04996 [Rhodococcus sp. Br-6]|nr:hypothetical protein Br6_04996 [Rhodococcus sp. Br-6]
MIRASINRFASTIEQTDGSSVVLHFEIKRPYGIQPTYNPDGTVTIEKR